MEFNYNSSGNIFTSKLCPEDEEKLTIAQNGAQAFSNNKARREALKVRETTGYLTLREAALRYHGFTKQKDDYSDPKLRYYVMAFPPTSVEVAALRMMEERLAPDPLRQALHLVGSYLPDAVGEVVEDNELDPIWGQEARNIWLEEKKADLGKSYEEGSLNAERINSLYQSDMAGLAPKRGELADIKKAASSADEPSRRDKLLQNAESVQQQETDEQDASRNDVFKAWLVRGAEFVGKYELPKLKPGHKSPEKAIPFDKALQTRDKNQWVHFFIDDQRFERVWNNPKAYLGLLKSFDGIISTDFSLYLDMPLAMQIWNTYRNRALAFWLQQNGADVIPNVQWGDERSYEFCFDGIPKNSIVAISTHGCIQGKTERFYFKQGLEEMVKRLAPSTIINYSYAPDDIFLPYKEAGMEIIQIPNWHEEVRERGLV